MDTTAAAELGMGKGPNGSGYWTGEGWPQQGYAPLQNPKGMNVSGVEWPGAAPSTTGYGILGQGQGRPPPYASEPPQKKMRTATGEQQGGYEYSLGKEYLGGGGDAGVGYAPGLNDLQGASSGYWFGAGSGAEVGYAGAANGGWYSGYTPGVATLGYGTNPSIAQNTSYGYGSQSVGYIAPAYGASATANTGSGRGAPTSRIFHKTRLCSKFSVGACTFGERCNFAHGMEDMKKPPLGWEGLRSSHGGDGGGRGQSSDGGQRGSVGKTRLCRIYYNEGTCPYGDTCSFLHDVEGLQPAASRDPSALSGSAGAAAQAAGRSSNWKTQICRRWGATGQCSFGENCHFAHGASELRVYGSTPATALVGSGFSGASYPNASNDGKIANSDDSQTFGDGLNGKEVPPGNYAGREETKLNSSNHLLENPFRGTDGSFSGEYSTQSLQQNVPFYYAGNNNDAFGQKASSGNVSKGTAHDGNN